MKTALCQITYDGYDWRNEVTVKSPSGKTISFCAVLIGKLSEPTQRLLIKWNRYWRDAKFGTGKQKFTEEISYDIMQELLDFSLPKKK